MSTERSSDEMALIDFLMGELPQQQRLEVQGRLEADESFRRLRDNIERTFRAISLLPEQAPPDDLAARTVASVARARQTEALIAREEARRRAALPTFSLRELAVAAAAVIIMAVALIPSIHQARNISLAGQCSSNVGQIGAGLLAYANANDDCLPAPDGQVKRWLPAGGGDAAFSNSVLLYRLVRSGYVSHVVFRCPTGGTGTFQASADMTDFPAGEFISYSYQHTLGPRPVKLSDPALLAVANKMVILADSTPVFSGGRFLPEKLRCLAGDNHGQRGQNVLYLDMHVKWRDRPDVGVGNNNIFLVDGLSDYRGDEAPADATDTFLLPTYTPGGSPGR